VPDLRKGIENSKFRGDIRFDEPMSSHTTFRVGGPADVLLKPSSVEDVAAVMELKREFPVFIFGAGANILVADAGIRGIAVDMTGLDSRTVEGTGITAGAGAAVSEVSVLAADRGLSGLEFLYAMPGRVGGSVWMNARCYGSSVSDVLDYVRIVDETGTSRCLRPRPDEFGYKVSPFQRESWAIVEAAFALHKGDGEKIFELMEDHRRDRERKGHFIAPCAGSVFKNDRSFGMPTGKIIDSLSLRGVSIGGAQVSPLHANIIINSGGATAGEIYELIRLIETRVRETYGFRLEREVRLVGDWGEKEDDGRRN